MTVSEQIIQVINVLCEKFGMVIDWTSENVIPYVVTLCGKLVAYEIWTSAAWIVFMLVLCLIAGIATKKLYPVFKKGIEDQGYWEEGWTIGACFGIAGLVIIGIATILVVGFEVHDIIKCVVFPEMYVFEYIQGLIG